LPKLSPNLNIPYFDGLLNRLSDPPDQTGNFSRDREFPVGQELPMQDIVEFLVRAFSIRSLVFGNKTVRSEPVELAAELLGNYRLQLARRERSPVAR
jgi:hypothetical protein